MRLARRRSRQAQLRRATTGKPMAAPKAPASGQVRRKQACTKENCATNTVSLLGSMLLRGSSRAGGMRPGDVVAPVRSLAASSAAHCRVPATHTSTTSGRSDTGRPGEHDDDPVCAPTAPVYPWRRSRTRIRMRRASGRRRAGASQVLLDQVHVLTLTIAMVVATTRFIAIRWSRCWRPT